MSGHGLHVHGPHDHALEHAAQHGSQDSLAGSIAVTTAVLATVGALFSYMGGATQAAAGLYKNDAAIRKTEASDQWSHYQSKSNKQNLAELAIELLPAERRAAYVEAAARYKTEKAEIQQHAERLEEEAKQFDAQSEAQMHLHHRWAQATTGLQISIALAAIALLTRRRWLQHAMYGVATIGLVLGGMAMLHL